MEKKILATIEEAVHNGDTAGANVLVIKDGKESAYCGYGMRDIENRLPKEHRDERTCMIPDRMSLKIPLRAGEGSCFIRVS